jgi:hypothetical protein
MDRDTSWLFVGSFPDSGASRNVSRLLPAFLMIETRQLRSLAGFFLARAATIFATQLDSTGQDGLA